MDRHNVSIKDDFYKRLEVLRKRYYLRSIAETVGYCVEVVEENESENRREVLAQ